MLLLRNFRRKEGVATVPAQRILCPGVEHSAISEIFSEQNFKLQIHENVSFQNKIPIN